MIKLTIDGQRVEVSEGTTVLEAAIKVDIYIPTLCYHPMLSSDGSCGLCLVEIEGMDELPTACTTKVADGMVVYTDTTQLSKKRRDALKQILPQSVIINSEWIL